MNDMSTTRGFSKWFWKNVRIDRYNEGTVRGTWIPTGDRVEINGNDSGECVGKIARKLQRLVKTKKLKGHWDG